MKDDYQRDIEALNMAIEALTKPTEVSMSDPVSQRIVCAALKNKRTGKVICSARHFDKVMLDAIDMSPDYRDADQGFIDQFGTWLTREEARVIAEREGQIFRRFPAPQHLLFSEHLY